jgi:single-strand DNA-binding protein
MAGETVITVVGNLTADPELRYTQSGLAVANFTIASTPRTFDKNSNEWVDGEALFLRASCWKEFAEHVAGSLTKGTRVIASGRLKQRSYETKEGEKRTSIELEVDEIGPSLRYATASVTRAQSAGRGNAAPQGQGQGQWAQPGQPAGPPQGQGQWAQPQGQPDWTQQQGQPPAQAAPPQGQWAPQQPLPNNGDVWNTPGTDYGDETPF